MDLPAPLASRLRAVRRLVPVGALLGAAVAASGARAGQAPQSLVRGDLRVQYWPGDEEIARRALDALPDFRFPGFAAGALTSAPLTVYLAPDEATFRRVARVAPDWGAGVAFPEEGVIVIPLRGARVAVQDWRRTLHHEAAHVALHRYLRARVPRWFDEGYAQLAAGAWDADAAWQLRFAILMGRTPPLDSLSLEFAGRAPEARVAYLLSYTAVRDLVELSGGDAFESMLRRWREGGDLDRAIRTTYGITLGQFERLWRQSVRARYGWLLIVSEAVFLWTVFTVLFLALGAWARRRRRHQFEAMRAREAGPQGVESAEPGSEPPALDPPASPP